MELDPADPADPADLAGRYVRLGRRLDRIVPGLVDADLGDPAARRAVAAEPRPDPDAAAREARALRAELPTAGLGPARTQWLDAQLAALEVVAARAAGRGPGVVEEVATCLGVRVAAGDADRYADAHRALDALLPGPGPLADRLAAHRVRDRVPPERLADAVAALTAALRARTAATLGLPAGERVDLDVSDVAATAPWSGFSRRTGPRTSSVSVNAGTPQRATQLPLLVAHEAYPGHHTDAARAEAALAAGTASPERALLLARTPQSLLAEGAAELGLETLVGPGWGRWSADVLATAPGGGVAVPEPELGEAVEDVMAGLGPVRQDAMLLLHGPGAGVDAPERAVAHLRRWLLVTDDRARRMLEFLAHPRWRIHTTTYVEGPRLLRPWLAPGSPADRHARYARLLDEPLTPDGLRAEISAGRAVPTGGSPR